MAKASKQKATLQGFMELVVLMTLRSLSKYKMSIEYCMNKVCMQSLASSKSADDESSLGRPISPLIFSHVLVGR